MLLCPASFFPDPLLDHTFQVHSGLFQHLLPDVDAGVGGGLAVSKAEDLHVTSGSMPLSHSRVT